MSTYRALVSQYKKECVKWDVPSETVKVYLLEICQREGINLYMDYEEE
ncbi:MAG: protein-(glutamine-N5) methyltransferase, release factor-specific, partial [Erysipelotrichaceae bacterium]|nr:protein-(glutamine-N5) methyltransferase, release factor-specific [Erysipelotrichaceae bacterium]